MKNYVIAWGCIKLAREYDLVNAQYYLDIIYQ